MVRNRRILRSDHRPQNSRVPLSAASYHPPKKHRPRDCWRLGLRVLTLALLFGSVQFLTAQEKLLPVFHFKRLSTSNGLSTNELRSRIVRDEKGFVWIGSINGVERYDGYSVKVYRNVPEDPYSLSSNMVMSLLLDTKNRLWVGTSETGLSLYDPSRDRFLNFTPERGISIPSRSQKCISLLESRSGDLWLGMSMGDLVRVELPKEQGGPQNLDSLVRNARFRAYPLPTPRKYPAELVEGEDGKIFVASDSGLIIVDPVTSSLSRLHLPDHLGRSLDSIFINCLAKDLDSNLWIGTGTAGVFRIDWKSNTVHNYRHKPSDSLSIRSDDIRDIVADRNGNIWIATQEGIDLFSPTTGRTLPYLTSDASPGGSYRMRLSVDRTGTLWIGTVASGAYWLSPKSLRIPHYSVSGPGGLPQSFHAIERVQDGTYWCSSTGVLFHIDLMSMSVLKSIDFLQGKRPTYSTPDRSSTHFDTHGNLWYGTWGLGLYRVNLSSGGIKNYQFESRAGKESVIRSIVEGAGGLLWTAAYFDGLKRFDPASGDFQSVIRDSVSFASHMMKDIEGRLWISTEADGLIVFDPTTGRGQRFRHDPNNPRSLSHDRTRSTYQDPKGRIWVGANNVINLYDSAMNSFERYPNPAFPLANYAIPIGSDTKGRLWVDYGSGVSVLDLSTGAFKNFDASYGLCGRAIDIQNLEGGRVLLTGTRGLNIFNADSAGTSPPVPPLVLTRISINDELAVPPPIRNGRGLLRLSYLQDVLEFEFACLDIDVPDLIEYQYRLEGLEKQWVKPQNRRFVRYTALPAGDYVFTVKAASTRGEWPDQVIALAVSIAPPIWKTAWAYTAYLSLLIGLLYAGYRVRLRQVQLKQEAQMEHFQAQHLAEVDRLKSRFFANISHEFRTPLTLILGPIRKWKERTVARLSRAALPESGSGELPNNMGELHNDMSMAERNAHRLLRLINQLLDLSKLESGAMKLHACCLNIVPFIKGVVFSFESSAGVRGVSLKVVVQHKEIEVYTDRDMVEKIVSNLLSNAFKFTPKGGTVGVTLTPILSLDGEGVSGGWGEGFVEIEVSDTGIGIPPDQLDKVFDRFYQVDASQTREQEGSGIGLALVKELVELHRGTIQVESVVGRGTTFTVRLPMGRKHLKYEEIVEAPIIVEPTLDEADDAIVGKSVQETKIETPSRSIDVDQPIVLVIEDNADVRAYIKDYLVPHYQLIEARDGAEGIEKAREIIPDLIVSDVMMPKKDGYDVCRTLKMEEKTSHIPIILLTAKAASENKIEGLEIGADDYLIKPFDPKELLARVKNLIDLRRKLRDRFSTSAPLRPGEIAVTSMDDAFLRRVMAVVEQYIGDEGFTVEQLGHEVAMSRAQLHRKLTALTDLSASEFIRYVRLHRAMDMLKKNSGTVSEIAYSVGFSDPSYFSRAFHGQFGMSPSEVRENHERAAGPSSSERGAG
jgi:signal transduction histidine kinase/ligand-binding sensor domain-containing protein/DNA-binding response OmpR family regulator